MSVAMTMECLVKSYRAGVDGCRASVEALRGIDLVIRECEMVGIVGPHGAGKSTLLLCAAGLLRPDAGRVVWFGRHRASLAPPPGIAFSPEHAVHYAFLTVRESLEYYATLQDVPGAGRRIDEAMARSALRPRARCRVSMLGLADRQRLGLARALLGEPRLLLLDAPLAGLDANARRETRAILRDVHESGTTTIVTAREPWELEGLVSRMVALVGGRVRTEFSREVDGGEARAGMVQPFAGGGLVAEHLS